MQNKIIKCLLNFKLNCCFSDGGGECLICAMAKTLQFSHQKSDESIKPFYIYNKLKRNHF